jgi:hypothetical protein
MAVNSEQLLDLIRSNRLTSDDLGDCLESVVKLVEIETTATLTREHWALDHGTPDIFGGGPQGIVN